MSKSIGNGLLITIFVVSLIMNLFLARNFSRPNYEIFPDMVHSIPYDSFDSHPDLPLGETLQPPPARTIARGFKPLHFGPAPEEALRAGDELLNPFPSNDSDHLKRGDHVYMNFCLPCHGANGLGDGPVSLKGFPPPASLLTEKAMKMKDGQIFHIITWGQGNMPSYVSQIERDDRWKVILHIRILQKQKPSEEIAKEP